MRGANGTCAWVVCAVVLSGCGPADSNGSIDEHGSAATAREALSTLLATYANAATYADEGELVHVITQVGRAATVTHATVSNAFVRPDRFRFVYWTDEDGPDFQILRDGSHVVSDFSARDGPEEEASLDLAFAGAYGVTEGMSDLVGPLLHADGKARVGLFRGDDFTLGEDASVDGVDCLSLETQNSEGRTRVLLGREDHLIRRVERRYRVDGDELSRTVRESLGRTAPDLLRLIESGPPEDVEETITLRPRLDDYVSPSTFALEERAPPTRLVPYGGIGARLTASALGGLAIQRLLPGGPAERADLRPGDRILEVDGSNMTGEPEDAIIGSIKGAAGTRVVITIGRGRERLQKDVQREMIADIP